MTTAPLVLDALAHLNQIGSAINRLDAGDLASVKTVLEMVVGSAARVVPGASAVLYTYDEGRGTFDNRSRVSAEQAAATADAEASTGANVWVDETQPYSVPDDAPRPDGMGARAVERQFRVLSYDEPNLDINPAKVAAGAKAMAAFPLVISSEVLGVLYVYLHEARRFSELELLMLENFVNLTAMTLSLARQFSLAQQEQVRKERELRRLRRAGMLISSRSNLKGTLDAILQVALEITDAIYGVFRLVDRSGRNLICMAISEAGLEHPVIETLPIDGHSVMGTVAMRREPVVISDLREEPWRGIYYPLDEMLEMRSEVAVPLIGASGRLEGVLNLESPLVDAFDRQHRYILQILATQAVVAIQEARLLDALQEISALLPQRTQQMILQTLVERACDLLNVPAGMIWLLEKDQLVCQAATEIDSIGLRIPADQGLLGKAILEACPVSLRIAGDEQHGSLPDLPGFHDTGSALMVPLFSSPGNRAEGVFSVYTGSADLRDFEHSDWDKKVLDILGHYATLAVQLSAQQEALRVAQDQRALTEAFAAVGDIAANLLHRLNNKVGTIPVRVEGIQDKSADILEADPYLARNLEEIQRSATEAMEVVRESLFHLHPIQLGPVSVAASIREALSSTRLPAEVRITVEGVEELPAVQAGSARLALVFSNLLENASDAMSGKGNIAICGVARGGWVELTVSDDGPGIPPEIHERIFEFNYSARASAHPGKLGFGLWWVKSLMARFGGNVSVESDGQRGTVFTLTLPQASDTLHGGQDEH